MSSDSCSGVIGKTVNRLTSSPSVITVKSVLDNGVAHSPEQLQTMRILEYVQYQASSNSPNRNKVFTLYVRTPFTNPMSSSCASDDVCILVKGFSEATD